MSGSSGQGNLLRDARQVADYAKSFGLDLVRTQGLRPIYEHVGAMLADSILQAGVNYRTVVFPRVSRILQEYPYTHTLEGVKRIVQQGLVHDYLAWRHPTKPKRFSDLVGLLAAAGVSDMTSIRKWLQQGLTHNELMKIKGVGPKTCDYLCMLVGLDHVAVDRHLIRFIQQAGVDPSGYDQVKAIVSFAADLLEVTRHDFDSWIWGIMASGSERQLTVNESEDYQ